MANSSSSSSARQCLSGARGDFVGSLGRKLQEARKTLDVLARDRSNAAARVDLTRKIHAVGSGARLFRFEAMAKELERASSVLELLSDQSPPTDEQILLLGHVIDDVPALAWGENPSATSSAQKSEAQATAKSNASARLVYWVGDASSFASLLRNEHGYAFQTIAREDAIDGAKRDVPALIVIDGDEPSASDLLEQWMEHEATDLLPVVVIGSFRTPDESARFIALGANKVLFKSARPDEVFSAFDEVLGGRSILAPMISGNPSLREFAARLVAEVERAFIDGADEPLQSLRIPVGDGADIQAAWWSAIARVQEIVAHRTEGQISFSGPWGHLAASPWLDGASSERLSRSRGAAEDVSLEGKRVLVVDDDPSIAWFLGDLLRNAGCIVQEANDGAAALEFAFSGWPDLVLSDILMPKLDGFGLLRILRRDVALRDVPVILLSWKEDLLQRMRELGANATGYLRKESDSRAVVARVREALWLRSKVENRIATGGIVRGRLDELSVASLLRWVSRSRPSAHLLLQDATFVYEVEIREGRLVSVERQAPGRNVESGAYVLEALLGVGSARFTVTTASDPVVSSFAGSLEQILGPIFLHNRSAMRILSGNGIRSVDKIELDLDRIRLDLRAFPDAARDLLEAFAGAKEPPAVLLDRASIDPTYFEQILTFVVSRGAVRAIYKEGVNLLGEPATEISTSAVYEERRNDLVSLASYASRGESTLETSTMDRDASVAELLASPAPQEVEARFIASRERSEKGDGDIGSLSEPRLYTEVEQVVEVEASGLSPSVQMVASTPSVPVEFEPLRSPSPHAPVTTSLAPAEMDVFAPKPRRKLWTGIATASVFAALFAWAGQTKTEPTPAPASQAAALPVAPTEGAAALREITPDELPLQVAPIRDGGIPSK